MSSWRDIILICNFTCILYFWWKQFHILYNVCNYSWIISVETHRLFENDFCCLSLIWLQRVLWHASPLVVAHAVWFPEQGLNSGPLHWERGVSHWTAWVHVFLPSWTCLPPPSRPNLPGCHRAPALGSLC